MERKESKIFLIEDNHEIRTGYALLIEDEPDLTLCGAAATAAEALKAVPEAQPDIVIVDVSLPDMNGIDLVRTLSASNPDLAILVVSGHDEAIYARYAIEAGARGYLIKHQVVEYLAEAVRTVLKGNEFLSEHVQAYVNRTDS